MRLMCKPCPFCCNPNAIDDDAGGACCFCDYSGEVSVGKYGMFDTMEQYNKVFLASNHQDRLDELHGRKNRSVEILTLSQDILDFIALHEQKVQRAKEEMEDYFRIVSSRLEKETP